jgi:pyruvate/2-oxoglutarate dehydrogenase complex dihydrolipoamide acyltransferase (E2) component
MASMPAADERRDSTLASAPDGKELPWAHFQQQTSDWLALAQARHAMHALLEVDVTEARRRIKDRRARTGRPLSFTAYITACLARAVAADPRVAAMRHGRRRLLVFGDVDVALPVESEVEDEPIPVPHIVRSAQRKPLETISGEISEYVAGPVPYATGRRLMGAWVRLPAWLRRRVLALVLADARRRKRLTGTVLVTAVGLPGSGRAWGLPNGTNYPVSLVIGGLQLAGDGRTTVALTLTFDHDTVNGAPAARFVRRFARLVESGELVALE